MTESNRDAAILATLVTATMAIILGAFIGAIYGYWNYILPFLVEKLGEDTAVLASIATILFICLWFIEFTAIKEELE